jgi:hypothetical protein
MPSEVPTTTDEHRQPIWVEELMAVQYRNEQQKKILRLERELPGKIVKRVKAEFEHQRRIQARHQDGVDYI